MHRLFVAIRPPQSIRRLLAESMGGIGAARWQSEDQLHITLRFIGEVDRHSANDVAAALAGVHHPRFEAALDGIGRFGREGEPGAVWAGLRPDEPFKALHKKIDQACVRAGLAPEGRAYRPHITLARLKRGSRPLEGLAEIAAGLSSPPFLIDAFSLFESILTPERAVHNPVQRYRLTAL